MKLELTFPRVSVIIAAYNEQAFIETTVESILTSGFPCEVIVVDDGSTDQTSQILGSLADRITVVSHSTNRGKGAAVASGLRVATGGIVILCDAHLLGLKQHHLLSLVLPLVYGSARAVLGVNVRVPENLSGTLGTFVPFLILTGQRAYFLEDLLPLADEMDVLGYGVETFLFMKFPRDTTAVVVLPGLVHLLKTDTSSYIATALGYLRETIEILDAIARSRGILPKEVGELRQKVSAILAKYTGTRENGPS
jgi:glycosyltransferase involved in cell wall biosynthesis